MNIGYNYELWNGREVLGYFYSSTTLNGVDAVIRRVLDVRHKSKRQLKILKRARL